ncbi:MAG: hypothetical protein LUE27_02085, partial [Clostridia bacterium]|nr:hypothetical protein [Clostridia bacterium]
MKKINLLKWGFLSLFCMLTTMVGATNVETNDVITCVFTGGKAVQSQDDFFTLFKSTTTNGETTTSDPGYTTDAGHGTAMINGKVYEDCMKVETGTEVDFTTTEAMILTIVLEQETGEVEATKKDITVDNTKYTATTGTNVITVALSAGNHTITKSDSNYIFYIGLKSGTTSSTYCLTFDPDGTVGKEYESSSKKFNDATTSVAYISSIAVTCPTIVNVASSTEISAGSENISVNGEEVEATFADGAIKLAEAIMTAGTYEITIPEGYFTLGTSDSNSAITLNYEVTGAFTGVAWDWENDLPAGIATGTAYERYEGYIESTVDGLYMYVDANNGKLNSADRVKDGNNDCQFNENTILKIPVVNEGDTVTVVSDSGEYHNFTIGASNTTASSASEVYIVTANDITENDSCVTITATGACYLKSITVSYATPVSSEDFSDEFARTTVKLTSEAPEDTVACIKKNEEIAFTAVNIPDGTTLTLKIDSIGETSTNIFSEVATASEDDATAYSVVLSEQINFNVNAQYKAYVEITKADGEEVGSYDLFTVVGKYNTVITWKADPDPDNDILTADTDAVIKLEYSEAVLLDTTQVYIPMNESGTLTTLPVTISNSEGNNATASKEWTLTVDQAYVALFGRTQMTVYVVAADEDDNILIGTEGDGTSWLEYYVDLVVDSIKITTIPADGDEVESIEEIVIKTNNVQTELQSDETDVIVLNGDGEQIAAGISWGSEPVDGTNAEIGYTIPLDSVITTAGTYTIIIPEGFFTMTNGINADTEYYAGDTIHVTIPEKVEYSWTFTPADSATVDTLSSITILEANGQEIYLNDYESSIYVLDSEGETVANGVDWSAYKEGNTILGENDIEIGYTIELDDTITTAGTYTIVIPEGQILLGDSNAEDSNAEIKITVTVSGLATGIKSVTLQATGDDKFYN